VTAGAKKLTGKEVCMLNTPSDDGRDCEGEISAPDKGTRARHSYPPRNRDKSPPVA